jgi:predicted nucleic acid-binding protein
VRLFLDTSVLLAACGSSTGASREIFRLASQHGWSLMASPYVLSEVMNNLVYLGEDAAEIWAVLSKDLIIWPDVLTMDFPVVFSATKDRPVLFTAMAWSDVLLTLDRKDFGALIGSGFYGLVVQTPGIFLRSQRDID